MLTVGLLSWLVIKSYTSFVYLHNIPHYNVTVTPILNISDQFAPNNVAVTLVWSHKNGISYSISVDPQAMDDINFTGKNSARLMLLYDTKYSVSVVASLCGHNSTALNVINYGKLDEATAVQIDVI